MAREQKMAIQKRKQEERARRAAERAKATTVRRAGRKLMFRSDWTLVCTVSSLIDSSLQIVKASLESCKVHEIPYL